MATAEEIAALRLLIAEIDDATYTDEALGIRLDAAEGANAVAAEIWGEKAAKYAALVDVSEAGSSRSLGKLQEQALRMVAYFRGLADEELPGGGRVTVIRRIARRGTG